MTMSVSTPSKTQQACRVSNAPFDVSMDTLRIGAGVLLVLFAVTLLSGCGFHLRGYGTAGEVQFKSVKLSGLESVQPDVADALKQQLKSSGVTIADSLAGAELEVRLATTYSHQSRTSYTGTGDVSSLLLTLKQAFEVEEVATEVMLLNAEVSSYRDHQIDNNALLASNRELEDIRRQMAQEVARQIVDRINRALLKRSKQGDEVAK
ncbi:LPS assembly lipoprotein LptE [Thiomicrorhabdus sp. ZW0627]|uniref:LPS-assembly lipoprotein LptE n=1 Tax=Thiomicrorhabdus sp. ZW0627 TaxID=3039774 RepID=UPI002436339B|nr:LPS assembly lipoprotein LptE [Thiomicrorhabdus sp. ZW0627]MDG6774763.1 LPS assembly lipoprotein LptE [Thiomicrorhabdus sp. ZW0627]